MNADAEVGLVHRSPDVYLVVLGERFLGARPESLVETAHEHLAVGLGAAPVGEGLAIRVGARRVPCRRFSRRDPVPTEYQHAVFFEGDQLLRVLAWYVPASRVAAEWVLARALSRWTPIDEAQAASVASEIERDRDPAWVVTETSSLRSRTYRDFATGFDWCAPEGPWRIRVGQAARAVDPALGAYFEEPALGISGSIVPDVPEEGETPEAYHARVLRLIGAESPSEPEVVTEFGSRSLSSWYRIGPGERWRLTTCTQPGRAVRLVLGGREAEVAAAEDVVALAAHGLSLPPDPVSEVQGDRETYRDLRFGFEWEAPRHVWRFKGAAPSPVTTMVMGGDGTVIAGVLVQGALGAGGGLRTYLKLLGPQLARRFPGLEPVAHGKDAPTFLGRPCSHLRRRSARKRMEVFVTGIDRTAFVLWVDAPIDAQFDPVVTTIRESVSLL
jgi:hypothetical protein